MDNWNYTENLSCIYNKIKNIKSALLINQQIIKNEVLNEYLKINDIFILLKIIRIF